MFDGCMNFYLLIFLNCVIGCAGVLQSHDGKSLCVRWCAPLHDDEQRNKMDTDKESKKIGWKVLSGGSDCNLKLISLENCL
jgi:hypothetical protein